MTAAIEVRDLRFRYHDGVEALRGLNFSITEGECAALIGPNGAENQRCSSISTASCPSDLTTRRPCSCWVNPLRTRISKQSAAMWACSFKTRTINYSARQFSRTSPLDRNSSASTNPISGCAFARHFRRLASRVSKNVRRIISAAARSGGVCLAGVLACEPRVLVLDEPTSDLDPRGRRELKTLLRQIPATKLIASHDLELVVELCPRAILLDEGAVVADGPTTHLLNNEALMLAHGLDRPHILQHRHPH